MKLFKKLPFFFFVEFNLVYVKRNGIYNQKNILLLSWIQLTFKIAMDLFKILEWQLVLSENSDIYHYWELFVLYFSSFRYILFPLLYLCVPCVRGFAIG